MKCNQPSSNICIFFTIWILLLLTGSVAEAQSYGYDGVGRLKWVTYDDGFTVVYTYDKAGNLLKRESRTNQGPAEFVLVFPANGQSDVNTKETFRWKKSSDPDGDTVTYRHYYCDNENFNGCNSVEVAVTDAGFSTTPPSPSNENSETLYYAVVGGSETMLVLGIILFGGTRTRKRMGMMVAIIIIVGTLLYSCGGGGGSGGDSESEAPSDSSNLLASDEVGYTVSDLQPNTQYYWKVIAEDGAGGTVTSETWSFTTK